MGERGCRRCAQGRRGARAFAHLAAAPGAGTTRQPARSPCRRGSDDPSLSARPRATVTEPAPPSARRQPAASGVGARRPVQPARRKAKREPTRVPAPSPATCDGQWARRSLGPSAPRGLSPQAAPSPRLRPAPQGLAPPSTAKPLGPRGCPRGQPEPSTPTFVRPDPLASWAPPLFCRVCSEALGSVTAAKSRGQVH